VARSGLGTGEPAGNFLGDSSLLTESESSYVSKSSSVPAPLLVVLWRRSWPRGRGGDEASPSPDIVAALRVVGGERRRFEMPAVMKIAGGQLGLPK